MSQESQSVRADIYRLLAALMRSAPSQELLKWLSQVETEGEAEQPMTKAWFALSQAANDHSAEQVEEEYQQLFIGIGRGEVMPFASWHLTGSLMEKPLAQLRSDLIRLGFERNEQTKEPEDHIAALCEVMALIESEAEQNKFFNQHIQPWYSKLIQQIEQAEHCQFYASVCLVMREFLLIEQTRFATIPVRETKFASSNAQ
jgi:TorA maturation chaperone TorD